MSNYPNEGLTFDDVSFCTQYADFMPADTSVKSRFSRNIQLNIPFVSAAMDTVTEAEMAIAMARTGGIGVVHRNLNPERQAEEVLRVKNFLHGLIETPVVFRHDMQVADLVREKEERNYTFAGFPIVDDDGRLCGILTARDIKFLSDHDVPVADVMSSEPITAPPGTSLTEAYEIMTREKVGKLPIVDDDNNLAGLYSFQDVKSLIDNINSKINRDEQHQLRVAAAIGPHDYERIERLAAAGVDALVIDTAHGHSKNVIETVREVKDTYPGIDVVAGNIATGKAASDLADAGADAVKVGIGPGSICTTRVVAGVGVPQMTAVYRVKKALPADVPIIADGGIRHSGDVPKAIAVGGDSVMMGSALAGTEESPGEKILHQGRTYVVYRGMGSIEAMKASRGSRERYSHADVDDPDKLVPQGVEGLVQYRGTVDQVLNQFVGGLRASLGYCGARNLEELRANAEFVRLSYAGLREGHAHDIKIIKDAPNYRTGE
jgi:IMP dehydrogenase